MTRTKVCATCGEPLDEYLDCPESDSGEHIDPKTVQNLRRRLIREMSGSHCVFHGISERAE